MTITTEELEKLLAEVTPGPWAPHRDPCHFDTLSDVRGGSKREAQGISSQLMVSVGGFAGWKEQEANTRLIAMAPALARRVIAAEKLVDALRRVSDAAPFASGSNVSEMIKDAIAEYEAAQ